MQIADSGLLLAIAADNPCGEDLEDTQLLASFDGYRLFGQSAPLSSETDWRDIRDRSLEALQKSKDFRLLTHLACAVLRTDGVAPFVETLSIAASWLKQWDNEVFPRVDEDSILRRNALNGFADRMAAVDGIRRATLLAHRQLGSVSIRDIEIATGQIAPSEGEAASMDETQLNALLAATATEELQALVGQLGEAVQSLKSIEESMTARGGTQAAPEFGGLATPLARTLKRVGDHLATRLPAQSAGADGSSDAASGQTGAPGGAVAIGGIRTRDDATRALDAVAAFFRTNEPSSPIPLLLERAKRLVAKDFLEVLAELAPEALAPARAASGVRDSND
jgi:type VI secretion system protein ImpA